jgi:hypothetical protein
MSSAQHRPLRYRGVRFHHQSKHALPRTAKAVLSIAKALLLSALALLLSAYAVFFVARPARDNIPGDVILDLIFLPLAVWADRRAIRRWKRTATYLTAISGTQRIVITRDSA